MDKHIIQSLLYEKNHQIFKSLSGLTHILSGIALLRTHTLFRTEYLNKLHRHDTLLFFQGLFGFFCQELSVFMVTIALCP